ncbi:GNAT family N-acetyltransferase [Flavobacterium piscisymbiosum]|uniref:GNAT family N-acetyltransferase n=1 Tax=Flavobacterium piscisymbiosum TaxID=2893753 RepID=A0ABS8MLB2_9FLAO|nr:GNAT family N-acetyltransferase [Flavobacterium sp. F-30]MCC9066153.1 GNAT family N-acetyltransferase [Flavobacterium sp. F-30]
MEIREIKNSDFDTLRTLFLKERQATFSWLNPSKFKLDDFEKHIKGELVLVAIDENIPVGFISIWMPNNFIHHFYIDQKYQGKGIGTLLLKAAIQQTNFPITLKCLEENRKAVAFYRKKGFIEKERGPSEHGDYILFELPENIN